MVCYMCLTEHLFKGINYQSSIMLCAPNGKRMIIRVNYKNVSRCVERVR